MGEVKRYEFVGGEMRERAPGWSGGMVYDHDYLALERDYARLERERDELRERNAECEAAVDQAVALAEYLEGHSKGAMAERVRHALSAKFAQERAAELTRLRAVEAAAIAVIDYPELDEHFSERMTALAEACGRKG